MSYNALMTVLEGIDVSYLVLLYMYLYYFCPYIILTVVFFFYDSVIISHFTELLFSICYIFYKKRYKLRFCHHILIVKENE